MTPPAVPRSRRVAVDARCLAISSGLSGLRSSQDYFVFLNTVKVGIKNLLLRKLRSLLTVLGVILGVGSVIAMLAIGEGSKREALEQIRRLGANNVIIRSVKPSEGDNQASTTSSSLREAWFWSTA